MKVIYVKDPTCGNRIKEFRARSEQPMSQSRLANILGVKQTTISAWERGVASPSIEQWCAMATLFQTDMLYLAGWEMMTEK